jgi:hypothetical protein
MIVKGSIEGLTCVILDLNFSCHFGSSLSQAQKHYHENERLGQTSDKWIKYKNDAKLYTNGIAFTTWINLR